MENNATGTDRFRSYLVLAVTVGVIAFNWLAATGRLGGVDTGAISDRYPTLVTPAGYAFTIWSLIYFGLAAFSIYQLLPANLARFRPVRSPYIFASALNCGWLYFWHAEQIVICFAVIMALALVLFFINFILRRPESTTDHWIARAPFELYFGWVTAAALVNFAIMLKYLRVEISQAAETGVAVALILIATALGIFIRIRLTSYLYPLAIAWAATAIAVRQSGHTAVVVASAICVIACLIAAVSFVMDRPSSADQAPATDSSAR